MKNYSSMMTDKMKWYKKRIAELEGQLKIPPTNPAQESQYRPQVSEVSRKEVWFGQEVPVVYAPLSSLDETKKIRTEEEVQEWLGKLKKFKILQMIEYI